MYRLIEQPLTTIEQETSTSEEGMYRLIEQPLATIRETSTSAGMFQPVKVATASLGTLRTWLELIAPIGQQDGDES